MSLEKNFRLLAWHNFLTDFRLYAPVAILYFTQVSGSFALGMSVFSITMLTQALLEVPAGVFSDLVGRARTVLLGSMAISAGLICYAIGENYWWLVMGAILEGLSRAFYSGNNDALLHDTLEDLGKKDEFADILGKLSALFQAALAVSAILGGVIANWSFEWVIWLSVIPQLIAVWISWQLTEPKIRHEPYVHPYTHLKTAWKLFIKNKRLRWLTVAAAIGAGAGEAIYLFNATFITSLWPVWAVGIQKALANTGATISFLSAGKLIKKFGAYPLLIWSRVYGRVTSVIAYGIPTFFSPLILASHSLLYGTITVADSTLQQKEFSSQQRATMGSLISLGNSISTGVLSVGIGMLGDWLGPLPALLLMQIAQAIPLVIYWRLYRNTVQ